ncbi:MAG: hypothetical protein GQ544_09155, partial [Candidatus Aminicenantes bacterium]|nr:hypothetical protein [Candidatus Aminicenantes bacterium]
MLKISTKSLVILMLVGYFLAASGGVFAQKLDEKALKDFNYREIGPTRQSGRFVDFAWNEKEPYTFYAATASGHLWKTVNNGTTLEAIFTDEKVFS